MKYSGERLGRRVNIGPELDRPLLGSSGIRAFVRISWDILLRC